MRILNIWEIIVNYCFKFRSKGEFSADLDDLNKEYLLIIQYLKEQFLNVSNKLELKQDCPSEVMTVSYRLFHSFQMSSSCWLRKPSKCNYSSNFISTQSPKKVKRKCSRAKLLQTGVEINLPNTMTSRTEA